MQSSAFFNPKSHAPAIYMPGWLIQIPTTELSHFAKLLYGRLAQWCGKNGVVHRSAKQLAAELGAQARTVERGIKELKEKGLLQTFRIQAGGVNHFRFLKNAWMSEKTNAGFENEQDEEVIHTADSVESANATVKNDATNPTKVTIPSVKSVGSKVKDFISNKRAPTDFIQTENKVASSEKNLSFSFIDKNFKPDAAALKKLHAVSEQKKIDTVELQAKFIDVHTRYRTRCANWNDKFVEFLEREHPRVSFRVFNPNFGNGLHASHLPAAIPVISKPDRGNGYLSFKNAISSINFSRAIFN